MPTYLVAHKCNNLVRFANRLRQQSSQNFSLALFIFCTQHVFLALKSYANSILHCTCRIRGAGPTKYHMKIEGTFSIVKNLNLLYSRNVCLRRFTLVSGHVMGAISTGVVFISRPNVNRPQPSPSI